eukprot:scaffold1874_cov187-Ochromonas_danica.AAC.1
MDYLLWGGGGGGGSGGSGGIVLFGMEHGVVHNNIKLLLPNRKVIENVEAQPVNVGAEQKSKSASFKSPHTLPPSHALAFRHPISDSVIQLDRRILITITIK